MEEFLQIFFAPEVSLMTHPKNLSQNCVTCQGTSPAPEAQRLLAPRFSVGNKAYPEIRSPIGTALKGLVSGHESTHAETPKNEHGF